MEYNPQIYHRRSIRLKGYNYSQAGAYFITICCHNRDCVFGNIPVGAGFTPAHDDKTFTNAHDKGQPQGIAHDNKMFTPAQNNRVTARVTPTMVLIDYGTIAGNEWQKLPERFLN